MSIFLNKIENHDDENGARIFDVTNFIYFFLNHQLNYNKIKIIFFSYLEK